jgi:hypothetical protein
MGFNSTWWMALVWLIVVVVAVFPFPWWWGGGARGPQGARWGDGWGTQWTG